MQPDPAELKALDDAVTAFDEAYVNLVQATRRIQRIYEIEKARREQHEQPPVHELPPRQGEVVSGMFCPRCHSTRLMIKGAGCMKCLDCQYDAGCGG